jgi:hypothetical protein
VCVCVCACEFCVCVSPANQAHPEAGSSKPDLAEYQSQGLAASVPGWGGGGGGGDSNSPIIFPPFGELHSRGRNIALRRHCFKKSVNSGSLQIYQYINR